jgi:hypothetical protein
MVSDNSLIVFIFYTAFIIFYDYDKNRLLMYNGYSMHFIDFTNYFFYINLDGSCVFCVI